MAEHCWLNGFLMPIEQAHISVLDHGVLYGDGIFEGIRVYRQNAFLLNEHLQRLQQSAQAIGLALPYGLDELKGACEQLIECNGLEDGYIRLVVTRGEGSLGLDPKNCHHPNVFILYRALSMHSANLLTRGIRLITASVRRPASDVLDAKIKSLNYLNNILAKMEANQAGADDALLLNAHGRVAEASAANVFCVKHETLMTPSLEEGCLSGITRGVVMQLARKAGMRVEEKPLSLYDLYNADEVFLTGSGAELVPVRDMDGRNIKTVPGRWFLTIQQAFEQLTQETLD